MISIAIASSTSFSKRYSSASFPDLAHLREAIAATGRCSVRLVSSDRWDDTWTTHATIAVADLAQEHLDWLAAPSEDGRYLVCGL